MNNTLLLWLKIVGWAIVAHIVLIGLSILEVFVYSLMINPGQAQHVYETHARVYAPFVALVFGIPVFYLLARRLVKRNPGQGRVIWIGLSLTYIVTDLLMVIPFTINLQKDGWILIVSYVTKSVSGYLGARSHLSRAQA